MNAPMTQLSDAIIRECRRGRRLSRFSASIRNRLEEYDREVRKQIVSRKWDECTPLFYASKTGNANMVEFLISTCGADVEQLGQWCFRDFETPLQRACHEPKNYRFGVVECLVKHGADINRADASGRTCLMEAVLNVKTCELLLKNGAEVNARDRKNKTALHYAVEEEMLDSVKLLLDYGVDVTLRSLDNDDALQIACLVQSRPIFDYLAEHGSYSPGRLADANELMGSCCFPDTETALKYWRIAIEIRNANAVDGKPLAKTPAMPKCDRYLNASEFTTLDELNVIAMDSDALTIQSLLVHERILGEHHRATFGVFMQIGATYTVALGQREFTSDTWRRCFDPWRRALEITVANNSISLGHVAQLAEGLVRALSNLHDRIPVEVADPNRVDKEQSRFADVVAIFKLLTTRLILAQPSPEQLLEVYFLESQSYDAILKCTTHLMDLLVKTARTTEAKDEVRTIVRHLVNRNPVTSKNHDTLLHLCVNANNTFVSRYFPWDYDVKIFPDPGVTRLLLECEADVNARNEDGKTPLHIVANSWWWLSHTVRELLLDHGAHLDTPDKWGSIPAHQLSERRYPKIHLVKYTTLRCLAAQAVVKYKIQCSDLPASVNQFLDLHRLYKSKRQY